MTIQITLLKALAVILGAALAVLGAAVALAAEPAPTVTIELEPDVDALVAAHSPGTTVTFTDDPTLNCGVEESSTGQGGCFRYATPDTVYISTGLRGNALTYVLLHELAHAQQFRTGEPATECAADRQAVRWGATRIYADQANNC